MYVRFPFRVLKGGIEAVGLISALRAGLGHD